MSVLRPALHVSGIAPVEAARFAGPPESKARRRPLGDVNLRLSHINPWRNKGRTLVTMGTLALCGILVIGVSTVGGSLLGGAETLAHRGVAGDMQITAMPSPLEDALPALTESLADQISAIDGVTAVRPIYLSRMVAMGGGIVDQSPMLY